MNLKKFHVQRKSWKHHGRTFLWWGFCCVNDNAKVDFENAQIMHCIFCYKNLIITTNLKTQVKKKINFLLQNKWNNHSSKTCGCKSYCWCKEN